jgi:broad specificity phosphatase PhoE
MSKDIMAKSLCDDRPCPGDPVSRLLVHRKVKELNASHLQSIERAIRNDRACSNFRDADSEIIQTLIESMEYFEFEAGESVVTQGDAGTHFFVIEHGALDVIANGVVVNTVSDGQAFGELALMYNCPRRASVVAKAAVGVWGVDGHAFIRALEAATVACFHCSAGILEKLSEDSVDSTEAPSSPNSTVAPSTPDSVAAPSTPKRTASQISSDDVRSPKRRRREKETDVDVWPQEVTQQHVCFIRHAEALHNVCDDNLWTPDNPLTKHGVRQCKRAREQWGRKLFDEAELVIVSPMTRTLQTAYLINGSNFDARWLMTPMCAETLSGATCDEGTPKTSQVGKLPWMANVDGFSELAETWWLEEREEEAVRAAGFLKFLKSRPEKRIVVVSHGRFLKHATGEYLQNACLRIMSPEDIASSEQKNLTPIFNFNSALTRDYESKPLKAILSAPLSCLKGIGQKKSAIIAQVGPKTVRGLAHWKYANWAEALCVMESTAEAGARDFAHMAHKMNINKAIIAKWEGQSVTDLLQAPLHAFEGLTEKQDAIFKTIGIKNIRDLGNWKYYKWARAVSALAMAESVDGSS